LQGDQKVVEHISKRSIEVEGSFFLPHLKPTMRVLDLGCGPGSITLGIAKRVESVVGIDRDPKSLQIASDSAKEANMTNIQFVEGSIEKLPFEDSSFDAVWGHAILCHMWAKKEEILEEIKRVLKKDGICAFREPDHNLMFPEYPAVERGFQIFEQVVRKNGGNLKIGRELSHLFVQHGFQEVDLRVSGSRIECKRGEQSGILRRINFVEAGVMKDAEESEAILDEFDREWLKWADTPSHFMFVVWIEGVFKIIPSHLKEICGEKP